MKAISWQLVVIVVIVVLCVTALELYALHCGFDGTILFTAITALIGIPAALIAYKTGQRKVK